MKTKYKEIFKLKRMLEKEGIPFDWVENFGYPKDQIEVLKKCAPDIWEHYHICYPNSKNIEISVIEGFGTYGSANDKIEIMGGLTPWERFNDGDEPIGWLTAHNVFKRIKNHWEEKKRYEEKDS